MTRDRGRRTNRRMDELFPQASPDECRVCTDPVVDGRWNYCSERCRRIARAVQRMFTWSAVRDRILERDDHTCQACGLSREAAVRAHWQMREIAKERTAHLYQGPERDLDAWRAERRDLERRLGCDSYPRFEVDHIRRVTDGGHPLDERNLQTLCTACHADKTAAEAAGERPEVPLEEYMA